MQLYSSHPNKRKKGEKEGNKEIISDWEFEKEVCLRSCYKEIKKK
jgi:hypothetical protein